MSEFGGKVVVITGAGGGVGKTHVFEFATCGDAMTSKASVSDRAGAKPIIQNAVDAYDMIETLVNKVVILQDKTFKNMTLEKCPRY